MKRYLAIAVLLTVLPSLIVRGHDSSAASMIARIEAPQPGESAGDSLDIANLLNKHHVPGISVAIIKDFQLHWTKAYGLSDAETRAPADSTTLFQAASISKPVTALAVVRAAQRGQLDLDTDINTALKAWQIPRNTETGPLPVTWRALLSHTSGSDDGFGFPGYDPAAPRPTLRQIFEGEKPSNGKAVLFKRPPFAAYKYSGGGTVIVQQALTDLSGRPFAEFMRETVLGPLNMNDSTFDQPLPAAREAQAARAHGPDGRGRSAKWHVYPEQAPAGLWTTSGDLARFVIEIQTALRGPQGALLDRAHAREMVTPVGVGPFAVGLMVEKRGEGWYFLHGGSNRGFRCSLIGHVRKGYGLVVMTNSDNGGAVIRELEARVAAAYAWDALEKPLKR